MIDVSFEDLFAGGSILEEQPSSMLTSEEAPASNFDLPQPADSRLESEHADEENSFFAVEDILRQEIESSFSSSTTVTATEENEKALDARDDRREKTVAPSSDMDLPYVDVRELLQQDGADAGVRVVDEPAVAAEKSFEALPPTARDKAGANSGEIDFNRREPLPFEKLPVDRIASASAPPERKRDGQNGLTPTRQREDDRERLLIAGLRHYKNQRFQEAIAEFEKAIRLFPDFKEAYSILGNAYFRNHMFEDAARAYARVKEMDPHDTTAYENMGVIYANGGNYVEAMKEWQRVLEIDSGRDDIRKKIERASRMVTRKAVV
jgi:tetratricopeptide (TPR) repeat protein